MNKPVLHVCHTKQNEIKLGRQELIYLLNAIGITVPTDRPLSIFFKKLSSSIEIDDLEDGESWIEIAWYEYEE